MPFFPWLSNTPLHTRPHFFIRLSIDGHLGSFYLLAVVNKASMNTQAQITVQDPISVLLDKYPEVELLNHMVDLFLIFRESLYCFPLQLYHFTSWIHFLTGAPICHYLGNTSAFLCL